jgi:hypothetical protein
MHREQRRSILKIVAGLVRLYRQPSMRTWTQEAQENNTLLSSFRQRVGEVARLGQSASPRPELSHAVLGEMVTALQTLGTSLRYSVREVYRTVPNRQDDEAYWDDVNSWSHLLRRCDELDGSIRAALTHIRSPTVGNSAHCVVR